MKQYGVRDIRIENKVLLINGVDVKLRALTDTTAILQQDVL